MRCAVPVAGSRVAVHVDVDVRATWVVGRARVYVRFRSVLWAASLCYCEVRARHFLIVVRA